MKTWPPRPGRAVAVGGRLHRDSYPRKPRGGPGNLDEAYRRRLSFTCSICDKRHTPASLRFLGRRVYLAVTVVLASAVRAGPTDWRVRRQTEWIRVPKRTLERWRVCGCMSSLTPGSG
jgi:hypothetical protein